MLQDLRNSEINNDSINLYAMLSFFLYRSHARNDETRKIDL